MRGPEELFSAVWLLSPTGPVHSMPSWPCCAKLCQVSLHLLFLLFGWSWSPAAAPHASKWTEMIQNDPESVNFDFQMHTTHLSGGRKITPHFFNKLQCNGLQLPLCVYLRLWKRHNNMRTWRQGCSSRSWGHSLSSTAQWKEFIGPSLGAVALSTS